METCFGVNRLLKLAPDMLTHVCYEYQFFSMQFLAQGGDLGETNLHTIEIANTVNMVSCAILTALTNH